MSDLYDKVKFDIVPLVVPNIPKNQPNRQIGKVA